MKEKNELSYRDLKMVCDQKMFKFETTKELEPINDGIGQERGIKMNHNFKKNAIWNTIGITINSFNSLFFLIIINRINGVDIAGIFSFAFSVACLTPDPPGCPAKEPAPGA